MKLNRYTILSLIVVMLTSISFNMSSSNAIDSTSETKIQITLEEKESKQTLDEKLIASVPEPSPKETKPFNGFVFSTPIVDQLYLNNIFKPPIFS
jgi:phage terminase large subunit-like protein